MSQVSYGTITITDTTDIERIYTVYAKSTNNTVVPSIAKESWSENVSTAPGSGNYIWQRTVVEKSGTGDKTYSDPVCLTGEEGTDATEISGIEVRYGISADWNTQPTSWSTDTPAYDSSKSKYWTRTRLIYDTNPVTYSGAVYTKDEALTKAVSDSAIANSVAQHANEDAQGAMSQAASNISSVTRLWWSQATATPVPTISTIITDGATNRRNAWSNVRPTNDEAYPYYFYCDQTITGSGVPSWSSVTLDTSTLSVYEINATNVRTQNFFKGKDPTYDGHFASGRTESNGLKDDDAETYYFNARVAATHISLGFNKTPIIDLNGENGTIDIYRFPTIDGSTKKVTRAGTLGMKLGATSLNFYNENGVLTSSFGNSISLASNGAAINIGASTDAHVIINSTDGIKIYGKYFPYDSGGSSALTLGLLASFGASNQIGADQMNHIIFDESSTRFYSNGGSTDNQLIAKIGSVGDEQNYSNYTESFETTWNINESLSFTCTSTYTALRNSIKMYVDNGSDVVECTNNQANINGTLYSLTISSSSDGTYTVSSTSTNTTQTVKFIVELTYTAVMPGPHYSFGKDVKSYGSYSYAVGQGVITLGKYQMAVGKYNEVDSDAMFLIGNGTDNNNRSNLMVVGENYVAIGNKNQSNIYIGTDNLQVKKANTVVFDVGNTSSLPYRTLEDIHTGDGTTQEWITSAPVYNETSIEVFIDGVQTTNFTSTYWPPEAPVDGDEEVSGIAGEEYYKIVLNTIPNSGVEISIKYQAARMINANFFHYGKVQDTSDTANYPFGNYSVNLGYNTVAAGAGSFACGIDTSAIGNRSHAEGCMTRAEGYASHAEGCVTTAAGTRAHAEGKGTYAFGQISHAEGITTVARGRYSHSQNARTIASGTAQTAIGINNIEDTENKYALIIGNGFRSFDSNYNYSINYTSRSNALTVGWDGYVYTAKDIDTSTVSKFFTVNSTNATISNARYIRRGNVVQLFITWTNKSAISVPANGNITNVLVGTLLTDKRPLMTTAAHSIGDNAGQCWYRVDTDGTIDLSAVESTGAARTIVKDSTFHISCTYIVE